MAPIPSEERMRRRGMRRNGKMLVGPILRQAMSACTDAACKEQQEVAGAIPMVSEERVRQREVRRAAGGLLGPMLWRAPEGAKAVVACGVR